ncbi:DUF1641 domain-containing protein [Domibacillus epiphyticus]|uniref:DUF1641 domain-containing protein n=1 Tax=Domibacillus epiphyticus TaxID=1714355 RepID=A0A1V2A412_9BACI|nr:DUF1641 domain-containing protein [Domibacillus epiphyticus]OMP65745.1 hypothetical protein BTO28_15890 [Domibacillus epiphyticus]
MAQAIRKIKKEVPNQKEEQDQATAEIMKELSNNKDAVIAAIQLMKGMQEMGIYDAVRGMLDNRTEVGAIAIQQMNQPAMHNVIKNGMSGVKFLGALQPGQMDTIMAGVGLGLKRLSETGQQVEKQSIWKMRKRLQSPEIRAAMTTMIDFMEGMGEAFLKNRNKSQ